MRINRNDVLSDFDNKDRELEGRQRRHLEGLRDSGSLWHPSQCHHNLCPRCHGTGISENGTCIHSLSCPCSRCSPRC